MQGVGLYIEFSSGTHGNSWVGIEGERENKMYFACAECECVIHVLWKCTCPAYSSYRREAYSDFDILSVLERMC